MSNKLPKQSHHSLSAGFSQSSLSGHIRTLSIDDVTLHAQESKRKLVHVPAKIIGKYDVGQTASPSYVINNETSLKQGRVS